MAKIFLLEDDPVLAQALRLSIELSGHLVTHASSLREARERQSQSTTDLYLLDVNLGDGSGFDFCREIRELGAKQPVIFLTARADEESVVKGFDFGGSDYLRKPFGQQELMARIRHQLSEKRAPAELLRFGEIILNLNQQSIKMGERTLELNRREFEILQVFFERPEDVITREQLISRLADGGEIFDRTIDSHISHIRSKLRKNQFAGIRIASVYGTGYRLEKDQ